MSTEIEAKFIVAGRGSFDGIFALTQFGNYSLLPGRMESIHDDYLDTPDRALLAAGYACRRRVGNGAIVMTVKSLAAFGGDKSTFGGDRSTFGGDRSTFGGDRSTFGGGIHRREELEVTIPADSAPAEWPASPARDLVLKLIGFKEPTPLFQLGQDRFVRPVVDGDRHIATTSLDEITLIEGGVPHQWFELEIELLPDGTDADLAAMCGWVSATLGLNPSTESKFEKALRMVSAAPEKASPVRGRRRSPPPVQSVLFDAPTDAPGELPFPALERMGYTARKRRSVTDQVTFYDTHDGAFLKKGFTVCFSHSARTWRLREDGKVIAEEAGEQSALPLEGAFGVALGSLPTVLPTIPLLEASVAESEYSLAGFAAHPLRIRARQWAFRSPLQPAMPRTLLRLTASGPATTIAYFASLLQEKLGYHPSRASVMERGMVLLGISAPGAAAPEEFRVAPEDSIDRACRKIFRSEAWRMRVNAPGAIRDLDPEFVHDLRVATRRARSASRLFDSILDPGVLQKLRDELRWIARLLGGVRDLDVLAGRLDTQVKLAGFAAGFSDQLRGRITRRRERALAELIPGLQSERFSQLLLLLESVGEKAPPESEALRNQPADSFARRRIAKAFRKLSHWIDRPADSLTDAELHQVRILFKRLRYTVDFFRPLLGDDTGTLIGALVAYQDCLGLHQDASSALRILADLLGEIEERDRTEELLLSMGALFQVQREAQRVQREKFSRRWESASELIVLGKRLRGVRDDVA